jgi:CHAT domain-containing protein
MRWRVATATLSRSSSAHSRSGRRPLGPEHPDVAQSLGNLAEVYYYERRYADAEPLLKRALAIREKALGPEHPAVAASLHDLAYFYEAEARYDDAEPLLQRAFAIQEKALGPEHPDVARSLNDLAFVYGAEGKAAQSREAYERARKVTLEIEVSNQTLDEKTVANLVSGLTQYLPAYASLLAKIAREPKLDPTLASPDAEGLAFEVAEQARGTMAQAALSKAAMRAATGDPATGELARKVQDLSNQRADFDKQLDAEYAKAADQQKAGQLKSLQQQSQSLDTRLAAASDQLYKACPRCGEFTAPEPITPADTQKLLRPGEALVSYFTLDDQMLAWVVRPGAEFLYLDTSIKRVDLDAMVARLRASLKPDRPYDVADAFALEKLLLKPFGKDLGGLKHLILVPDNPLLPIPFAALVVNDQGPAYTALADAYRKGFAPSSDELRDDYTRIPWLARSDFTISELPSATSLRALRGLPSGGALPIASREPFIGVGDPVLGGEGHVRGGAMLATRGASSIDEIRKLPRLPGTRDELIADARALGADPSSALFMGERATKPEVMELNHERLARTRVVAFATHALTGGGIKGFMEPALVLTPPRQPSENDDGLLGLDDVMQLKLKETEWVVLSACNTAAPGGGGEGFSGLVRAFFYAGTPSLLVSQWSVDDAATDQLMTAVFTAYGRGTDVSRAASLHDAMLKLIDMPRTDPARAYFAHPFAWAPFIVVGEDGVAPNGVEQSKAGDQSVAANGVVNKGVTSNAVGANLVSNSTTGVNLVPHLTPSISFSSDPKPTVEKLTDQAFSLLTEVEVAHEKLNVSPLRNAVAIFASDSLTLEQAIQANDDSGEAKGIEKLRSDRHAVESQMASGHAPVGKDEWNGIALTLDQLQGQIVKR